MIDTVSNCLLAEVNLFAPSDLLMVYGSRPIRADLETGTQLVLASWSIEN